MDAASSFMGTENVPKYAITMGISTIMKAKRIIIMGFSEVKAKIIAQTVEGKVTVEYPASFLQQHSNVAFYMDHPAAEKLTRYVAPWTIKGVNTDPNMKYDDYWTKKAVIWLSLKLNKPILSLIESDYEDNDLLELLNQVGNGHAGIVNLKVFKDLQNKITGWPAGGRPDEDKDDYFKKKSVNLKTVLIFSPHPDDDVICMAGTMEKLVKQGHCVHVAYQTSGNIAVFDHDAARFTDFVQEFIKKFKLYDSCDQIFKICNQINTSLQQKTPEKHDDSNILAVKGLIRRCEARSAAIHTGVLKENIYSLDLPFYETGAIKKNPKGPEDIKIIKDLIIKINPDMIFAAGDLTDPHGTHRVCLETILAALDELEKEKIIFQINQKYYYIEEHGKNGIQKIFVLPVHWVLMKCKEKKKQYSDIKVRKIALCIQETIKESSGKGLGIEMLIQLRILENQD
ncbi:hypothetical protein IMG5_011620 [Ichthyophthirius multifiliis]|uniref:N-acetylglucosaminylphosphatidylinositol deacetylase n=1 Tax=Ichthyophthirius multifiliis TaxID=5932 RepID=G0QK21_ICHMU|nr:hypothetical protein IMG5_011620 [Ichthyophthirius multifiliis]EGR34437.1 hypothetical protein IMG5_011620 [Ichthyophthirius multifiliis]|eukprot:XP_004039741.1 hypothetical protein IMG5_011620 [Ichthyophthirius multifiliis]